MSAVESSTRCRCWNSSFSGHFAPWIYTEVWLLTTFCCILNPHTQCIFRTRKCHSFYLDNAVNGCGQVADFWSLSEEYGVTADFLFQSGRVEVVLAPGRVQWHKCRQCMCQIAVTLCWGSRCFLFILLLTQNSDICEFSGLFRVFSNSIVLYYAGKF